MSQKLYNSDIVSLNFDSENQLIEMIWKSNPDSEEYRKMFEVMIEFSKTNHIRFVISDMRNEGLVRPEDVKWMSREVLQRAIEHNLERLALVIEDSIFASVYADVVKNKLKQSPIKVQVFSDTQSALAWLLAE